MNLAVILDDLSKPQNLQRLKDYIRDIYDEFDSLALTDDPNGVVQARLGKTAVLTLGGLKYWCVNTDGATEWKKVQIA